MQLFIGDFTAKSKNQYFSDNTTSQEHVSDITSQFGIKQVTKPAHILNNSSSCIGLVIISLPNLITESEVH